MDWNSELESVLDFWFSEACLPNWFMKDVDFDQKIRDKYNNLCDNILEIPRNTYEDNAKLTLAVIITMDQFPRNIFRGAKESFRYDKPALMLAKAAVEKGHEKELSANEKLFLYKPYEHSEDIDDQEESVRLATQLTPEVLFYSKLHRDIIQEFGRFPHRNVIVGRESTARELAYLEFNKNLF